MKPKLSKSNFCNALLALKFLSPISQRSLGNISIGVGAKRVSRAIKGSRDRAEMLSDSSLQLIYDKVCG